MKISTKIAAFVLSFIPGLGQILTGRHLRGMVFFFSFLIIMDITFIIIPCIWGYQRLYHILAVLVISATLIWLSNILDILRIIWWRERTVLSARKKPLFQEALTLYLRDDFTGAVGKFREILRLDRDDPDALFWLGMVFKHQKKPSKARRYFNRSLVLDETEKWQWEVAEEVKSLKPKV